MTDSTTIALNRLTPWKGNVRKTGATEGIDELAASIAAHGLLQSLVVREGKRGKYEIIAGRRRFLALTQLAKQGTIEKDHEVSCTLAAGSANASELSLAENVVRISMHPADQFEAFSRLIDSGTSTADVATRFGVSEKLIAQRMKLGRLSPVILDAYRNGEIDLECAQAFALSDDHAAQERVFTDTSWNCNAYAVRRALTEGEIRATDKRVRFVGLDAYESAGGTVRRDLFGDDSDAFVLDGDILNRLVAEKLSAIASEVASEGWSWTKTVADLDHQVLSGFGRRYPERATFSDTHQAEFDRLSEEYDLLVDSDEVDSGRLAEVEDRIDQLHALAQQWTDEIRAVAGAIVYLDYDGSVSVERGLVRPDDLPEDDPSDARGTEHANIRTGLSPRLIEDLTAQKTAAIGAELLAKPGIALAAVVHSLALEVFYPGCPVDSCLRIGRGRVYASGAMANPDACTALTAITQEHERFGDRLPGNPAELWNWLLGCSRDELLCLLAYIAASAVDAVQRKVDRPDAARLAHADLLALALQVDMDVWFKPTAESYFGRVNRAQILAAIDEANGVHAPSLEKLKKSELAVRAEQLVAGKAWLPEPLRIAVNDGDTQAEAAE